MVKFWCSIDMFLKRKTSYFLCFFIALIGLQTTASAQNGGFAGAFTRLGFGPRGMAMGNTMTAYTGEGIYAHYNPALAALANPDIQVDISTAALEFDRSLHMVSGTFALPPNAGFSFSFLNANVDDIDGRSISGFRTSSLSTNEYQFKASFGIQFSDRFSAGAGFKFNLSDFDDQVDASTTFGVDLGFLYQASDQLTLGIAIQDLLAEQELNTEELFDTDGSSSNTDTFPKRFKFAASYQFEQRPLTLNSEFEIRTQTSQITEVEISTFDGIPEAITRNREITTSSNQWRAGSSYKLHERITARAGYQIQDLENIDESGQVSFGFSVHLPLDTYSPAIDYAFIREPGGFSNIHAFAIRLDI